MNKRAPDPFPLFQRTGTPDDMNEADANIEAIADRLIAEIEKPKGKKAAAVARHLAYAFAVHRTRRGKTLTEHHLRLLAAALRITKPSARAAAFVGLSPVEDLATFIRAADIEASIPGITANKLAAEVGVDHKTIKAWRTMDAWRRRVAAVRAFGE